MTELRAEHMLSVGQALAIRGGTSAGGTPLGTTCTSPIASAPTASADVQDRLYESAEGNDVLVAESTDALLASARSLASAANH
jgi:energy-converting hydrogenase Eha subunit B